MMGPKFHVIEYKNCVTLLFVRETITHFYYHPIKYSSNAENSNKSFNRQIEWENMESLNEAAYFWQRNLRLIIQIDDEQ